MYHMFFNSIGTLFHYIFNYHHYDNALMTPLVSYYLYQYWRDRIGNNLRRHIIWRDFQWCIICFSIRSVRYFVIFLITIITITHTLLRLSLPILTMQDSEQLETIECTKVRDDRWHNKCSICIFILLVRQFITFTIIIVTITHAQLYLFPIISSTTVDDRAFGNIGRRCVLLHHFQSKFRTIFDACLLFEIKYDLTSFSFSRHVFFSFL